MGAGFALPRGPHREDWAGRRPALRAGARPWPGEGCDVRGAEHRACRSEDRRSLARCPCARIPGCPETDEKRVRPSSDRAPPVRPAGSRSALPFEHPPMSLHTVRRGFDVRVLGAPTADGRAAELRVPSRIALLGADYPGMRPTMRVREGDAVSRGDVLFEDKKTPGVRFTAPLGGRVAAVHRGERRAFLSLVIEVNPDERAGGGSAGHAPSEPGPAVTRMHYRRRRGSGPPPRVRGVDRDPDPPLRPGGQSRRPSPGRSS